MKKLLLSVPALCFGLSSAFAQIPANATLADPTFNGGLELSSSSTVLTPIGNSFSGSAYLFCNVSNASAGAPNTGVIPAGAIRLDLDFPASYGVNTLAMSVPNWTVLTATSTTGGGGHLELVNSVDIAEGDDLPAIVPIAAFTVASALNVVANIERVTPTSTGDVVTSNNSANANITTTGVLPVVLSDFGVRVRNCAAQLDWISKSEDAFAGYQVQHSQNGTSFLTLTTVHAKGSNSTYTYTHTDAPEGANYYRLKMVDHDGSYAYSPVKKATISCADIHLAPTVTMSTARVMGLDGTETIKVINSLGQTLLSQEARTAEATIDLSGFAAGMYQVTVIRGAEQVYSGKIVKQ